VMFAASVEPIPVTAASAPIPNRTRSRLPVFGADELLSDAPPRFKISTRFLLEFFAGSRSPSYVPEVNQSKGDLYRRESVEFEEFS